MSDSSVPEISPATSRPNMVFCSICGAEIAANAPVCIKCGAPNIAGVGYVSEKTMVSAALLCFFLGGFGAHRFYVGKTGTGILMLVLLLPTFGVVSGIWALIDFVMILTGSFRDKDGLPLKR